MRRHRSSLMLCFFVLISLCFISMVHGEEVTFPDPNLEAAIREALNKPEGAITDTDLQSITELNCHHDWSTPEEDKIADLTGLEYCINLTSLSLSHNKITDISLLTNLTVLTFLHLGDNQISDISYLANLNSLMILNLGANQISDISYLANLNNLTYLSLGANQISDSQLTYLANLNGLTYLGLDWNGIADISPLANLTNLARLELSHNQISDISSLANLTDLSVLYLDDNQIQDISSLSDLTNLQKLDLNNNQIVNLNPLSELTNLQKLRLGGNQIIDISPLGDLTSLQKLRLRGNQISNLSPLSRLINLQVLNLDNNQIIDISPLSDLTNLRKLRLRLNQISDIGTLVNLKDLGILYLDNNQIQDISPLAELTKIGELYEELEVDERDGIEVHLGLSNNLISELQPLVDNTGIDSGDGVDLGGNSLSDESIGMLRTLKGRGVKLIGVPIVVPDIEGPHALSLDGDGDFVQLPSNIFNILGAATIEGWIRWESFNHGSRLIDFGTEAHTMLIANSATSNTLSFRIWDHNGDLHEINVPNVLVLGKWHHIAATSGSSGMKLYLNGKLVGTNDYTGSFSSIQNGDNNYIGRSNWYSHPDEDTHCQIDEVRIWNVARTQEEIQATMNTTLQGDETGLVGYWNFDDGTANDLTANENHGTLHGDAGIMPLVGPWPPPKIGDVSGNGEITAYDASLILQYVVGLIDEFPANTASISGNIMPRNRTIRIPNLSAKANDRIGVQILLDNADDMLAGGITIGFDPSVLRPVNVMSNLDGAYFQSKIDGDQIRFAFVKLGDVVDLPIHDEQVKMLAMIEFEPIGDVEGMTTELRIDHAQISESLSIKLLNGSIEFLPSKTVLLQNYPNPFNPETWIPFRLAETGEVVMTIYDLSGASIKTLDLGYIEAGSYVDRSQALRWDGRNEFGERVASGVYIYQLQVGDKSFARRMVVLK